MADISIQFNAVPEELSDFVQQCVTEHRLHVVRITFPPYHAEEVSCNAISGVFANLSRREELAFTLSKPSLPAKGNMDFYDMNPDALRLNIGKYDTEGLGESHLSARTDNPKAIAVWKRIAKRLKGITRQGATASNPDTGDSGPARWQRFTEGALKLHKAGIPLLTITGIVLTPSVNAGDHAVHDSP